MSRRRKPTTDEVHRALADRDGGWWCYYCGHALVEPDNPACVTVRVAHPCPGGHGDVYPCDRGCDALTHRVIADGYRRAEADHVLPKSRGGSDAVSNRVLACSTCNTRKGAKTPGEWLRPL